MTEDAEITATNYTVTCEHTVKNRLEVWVAKAYEVDNPARCLGTADGWSEVGARNNLARLMSAQFRKTLRDILEKPVHTINYRNL